MNVPMAGVRLWARMREMWRQGVDALLSMLAPVFGLALFLWGVDGLRAWLNHDPYKLSG